MYIAVHSVTVQLVASKQYYSVPIHRTMWCNVYDALSLCTGLQCIASTSIGALKCSMAAIVCMVGRAEELSVGHDVPMVWMDG